MTKKLVTAVAVAVSLLAMPAQALPMAKQGEACGGLAGTTCASGLWCDPKPGACRSPDLGGVCVTSPAICTALLKPVCGCDGKTHSNDCWRQNSRVPAAHDGACKAGK